MNHKDIGLRIKEVRKAKGLSQKELAERMGYKDPSTLAKVETGVNGISVETLLRYAEVLGVSVGELLPVHADPHNYIKGIREKLGSQKIILNCAGGLIAKDGKILFQKRSDNNKWGLVGGLLELNETYLQAAIREVKEETGLDVKPTYFLGMFHHHNMVWSNGDKAHTIGAYYVFEITGGELRIDEESLELRFFSKDEIPPLFAEDHRAAVKAYFEGVRLPIPEENPLQKSRR